MRLGVSIFDTTMWSLGDMSIMLSVNQSIDTIIIGMQYVNIYMLELKPLRRYKQK